MFVERERGWEGGGGGEEELGGRDSDGEIEREREREKILNFPDTQNPILLLFSPVACCVGHLVLITPWQVVHFTLSVSLAC